MVRKVDGQVYRFKELTTLQKWIVERKVVREDEISRTGRSWKRLGEIAELTSFFQVVEAAALAQRSVTASMMPQVHLTATQTGTFQAWPMHAPPPAPTVSTSETSGSSASHVAPPPLPAPSLLPLPAPLAPSMPSLPSSLAPAPASAAEGAPPRLQSSRPQPPSRNAVDLDDDDDPVVAFERRRRRWWLAAGLVVVAAIAVVTGVLLVERGHGVPPELQASAQQALALGDEASRARALEALDASTAPGTTALRARLLAEEARAWREALRVAEEAKAVQASMTPAGQPAATTTAGIPEGASTRAETLLAQAGAAILQSRAEGNGGVDAALAAATAALAAADFDVVAREVGAARELSRGLHEDARHVVDDELRLLMSLAEASRVGPKDREVAEVVREKLLRFGDARARAAAAVASLVFVRAARDAALASTPPSAIDGTIVANAKTALSMLPAGDPRQPAGLALLTALSTLPVPPEPEREPVPVVDPPDAGAPDSFDALMARGEKAMTLGKGQAAWDAFRRATAMNPKSAKAWLKLGWAALDAGKKAEAPRHFQRALSLSPSLSEAQFGLAEAYRFLGRADDAVAAYKEYLRIDPRGKDAAIAKNAITRLSE
jgi:tetratricopeptide (TPR) repeat protein